MSREDVGEVDVVDITTTTGTFIAEGFLVHNCGQSGKLLEEILERVYAESTPRFYTNAMACRPPEDAAPYLAGIAACRQRLLDEVNAYPRRLVVAMGNSAVRAVTGLESVKITSLRGQLMASDLVDAPVFPTFHPAAVLRQKGLFHTLADDLERAMGRVTGRRVRQRPGPTTHEVATSFGQAIAWANELSERGVVAVDIETTGLDKRLDRVIAVGLSGEVGKAFIVPFAFMPALKGLLEGRLDGKPRFLYHNGRFDAGFLRNNGIEAHVDEDSLLLSYCLDEQPGRHGLKQLSNDILGAPDYELPLQEYKKTHNITGDYSQIPEDILFPYLAMDVDYTLQLYNELMPAVFGVPALKALYQQLLIPASDLLTEVERAGFWVDPIRIEEARTVLTERKELASSRLADLASRHWNYDAYKQWLNPDAWLRGHEAILEREARREELVGRRLAKQEEVERKNQERLARYDAKRASAKKADSVKPPTMLKPAPPLPAPLPPVETVSFNPGSPQQVRWMLQQWGIHVESTDSKTLEPFQEDSTFVQWLLSYRKASKLLGTYVEGITRAISDDGRIHANFNLSSTVTGRLSSSEPLNLQNIPRDPLLRGIFGAPRGKIIVEADYSQAELRMLAHLSGDPFLREVYDNDRDLHSEMAKSIFGEGFTTEQRTQTKIVNFGIAYGMSGFGLSKQLKIPVAEAERMIEAWYARVPHARAYLESCKQAPMDGQVLVTPFGRHRRYGLIDNENAEAIQREASNMVIQSAASDLTLISAILLREPLAAMGAKIVNIVHDSILVECESRQDVIDQVATAMLETMRMVPRVALQTPIPFDADAKYGSHWGVDSTKFKEVS